MIVNQSNVSSTRKLYSKVFFSSTDIKAETKNIFNGFTAVQDGNETPPRGIWKSDFLFCAKSLIYDIFAPNITALRWWMSIYSQSHLVQKLPPLTCWWLFFHVDLFPPLCWLSKWRNSIILYKFCDVQDERPASYRASKTTCIGWQWWWLISIDTQKLENFIESLERRKSCQFRCQEALFL